jgi:hypothetical protein
LGARSTSVLELHAARPNALNTEALERIGALYRIEETIRGKPPDQRRAHRQAHAAGADSGGERAAAIYSLVGTAKLNGIDPEVYLRFVLARIAEHAINRIDDAQWVVADQFRTAV